MLGSLDGRNISQFPRIEISWYLYSLDDVSKFPMYSYFFFPSHPSFQRLTSATPSNVAIIDDVLGDTILAGGTQVLLDSWGFGLISNSSAASTFANGRNIPVMNRTRSLMDPTTTYATTNNMFRRRRPTYTDIPQTQIFNVKDYGAKGDGVSDDTSVLNAVFSVAANLSSIVYVPFGVYVITDTIHIPLGSRIIGQAWSQLMLKGTKFQDINNPYVGVQVGKPGDVGVIEIQDLLFTVSGPTAGAILVEWNVHESTQGSACLWGE